MKVTELSRAIVAFLIYAIARAAARLHRTGLEQPPFQTICMPRADRLLSVHAIADGVIERENPAS